MTTPAPKRRRPGRPVGTHAPPVYVARLPSVGVTREQHEAVGAAADRAGESVAEYVRDALERKMGNRWPR